MNEILKSVLVLSAFSSCASTEMVHLRVQQPASVTIPSYIKDVVLVNRSKVSKKSKIFDVVDKFLSLEGANIDKDGSQATIAGLLDELKKNGRFDEVIMPAGADFSTDVPGMFPSPLPWDIVEKYCNENKADALFSLELFDTRSTIDYTVNRTIVKTPLGNIPAMEQQANMHTVVKAGWRIYDLRERNILDECVIARNITYHGRGINPMLAAAALVQRKEAVKQVGNLAGHAYAFNIIPLWNNVTRQYYARGNSNFSIATRKARTGNWDGAAQIWQQETNNADKKIAGRACYNMAIVGEINGDLDIAIHWAKQSYEDYNNHLALNYLNLLKNRKINDAILADQQIQ